MNQLRQKRKELGITQVEAANLCGVSRRTYQTYETEEKTNDTFQQIIDTIEYARKHPLLNIKAIKSKCNEVFINYPEVSCAFLYGSYARKEERPDSDVDLLVVCPPMGMDFYKMASELEDILGKEVDLQTHRQILGDEAFIETILKEGVKIYG